MKDMEGMEAYLQVGVITSTHGLKGECKVFPTTDDMARFKKLKEVRAETGKGMETLRITQVRFHKNMAMLKFDGIDTIEEIQAYKGCSLLIPRKDAVPLAPGEYFLCDLVGLAAYEDNGNRLGTVKEILRTGANDVYVVEREDKKEVLIPNIKDCILEVSLEEKRMTVHLLEGLL